MWQLKRNNYEPDRLLEEESLFTVANGYIGIRGCFEEEYGSENISSIRGSYINGLYDRIPLYYAESAYGFPKEADKQPRIIDTQTCKIFLDGEQANLSTRRFSDYSRCLDYKNGVYTRSYSYTTKTGREATIQFRRLASLKFINIFIYEIKVDYDGQIKLVSVLDSGIENYTNESDPRVGSTHSKLMELKGFKVRKDRVSCIMETVRTKLEQATVVDYRIDSTYQYEMNHLIQDNKLVTQIDTNKSIVLNKVCVFTDGLRYEYSEESANDLADSVKNMYFDDFVKYQAEHLKKCWDHSDIRILGCRKNQAEVRYMLYQLLQNTGTDKYSNVSAKGLSGEGYEGHYFWDTEIYILPLLQITQPETARKLLEYRYNILSSAIMRARELGHKKGATYPWRTISGIECSAYFPAGTAQYHINADIAYAFIQHFLFNQDYGFLVEMGAEVIYETARIWLEIGNYSNGKFMINSVTGPDEYTALVNNNYYTNSMAKYHLYWTEKVFRMLSEHDDINIRTAHNDLCVRIGLNSDEVSEMLNASESMFLPFDENLNINPQDDSFLQKPVWPFNESKYPLLLNYHPLTIYRYQVNKQPDTVLSHFLLEEYTSFEIMRNSYNYYEKLSTHDSSLSACIHGIMAARICAVNRAYDYFEQTVSLDLENTHSNTKDGLHMANIGGAALMVISGFGGFRINEKGVTLRPQLPARWKGYEFKIQYQNREISVSVSDKITVNLLSGEPLQITIWDKKYLLSDTLNQPLHIANDGIGIE